MKFYKVVQLYGGKYSSFIGRDINPFQLSYAIGEVTKGYQGTPIFCFTRKDFVRKFFIEYASSKIYGDRILVCEGKLYDKDLYKSRYCAYSGLLRTNRYADLQKFFQDPLNEEFKEEVCLCPAGTVFAEWVKPLYEVNLEEFLQKK